MPSRGQVARRVVGPARVAHLVRRVVRVAGLLRAVDRHAGAVAGRVVAIGEAAARALGGAGQLLDAVGIRDDARAGEGSAVVSGVAVPVRLTVPLDRTIARLLARPEPLSRRVTTLGTGMSGLWGRAADMDGRKRAAPARQQWASCESSNNSSAFVRYRPLSLFRAGRLSLESRAERPLFKQARPPERFYPCRHITEHPNRPVFRSPDRRLGQGAGGRCRRDRIAPRS